MHQHGTLKVASHREPSLSHGLLDVATVLANRLTGEELNHHIFRDQSDFSEEILKRMLLPGSTLKFLRPADVMDALCAHGAALVADFHVPDDFMQVEVHKHHEAPAS